MYKTRQFRSTFWSSDVEQLHATVAKSTFGSQNVKKLWVREHFLKFRCRKIVRRCGQKAHLEVKMLKKCWHRNTFSTSDVEKLHAAVAKSTFWSQNVKKLLTPGHFLKFWRRKNARRCSEKQIWKWKCTKHVGFGAIFEVLMSKN